jgi:hypothetical protein
VGCLPTLAVKVCTHSQQSSCTSHVCVCVRVVVAWTRCRFEGPQEWSVCVCVYTHTRIRVYVSRDTVVGIATWYAMDRPEIESRWRRDFPHPPKPALGPTQPPVWWAPDLFPEGKRPGRGVNHPSPSSTDVKEKVELYLYSPSGSSWPAQEWNFTLHVYTFIGGNIYVHVCVCVCTYMYIYIYNVCARVCVRGRGK